VDLATVAGAGALAAILGARFAALSALTLAVAAHRCVAAATAAAQSVDFVNTNAVPLLFAAVDVIFANAVLNRLIVAARGRVCLAAAGAGTLPAIFRAGEAIFNAVTSAVSAASTLTVRAPEIGHFLHADIVPGEFAAEGVLLAHTSLDGGVVAPGAIVRFAAVSRTAARSAILGA